MTIDDLTDDNLRDLIRQKAVVRNRLVAEGDHWTADRVNERMCFLADELARRKAARRVMAPFEEAFIGIVGIGEDLTL